VPQATHPTAKTERALLVAIEAPNEHFEHDLEELRELVYTAGGEPAGTLTQRRDGPHPVTYLGKGKVDELRQQVAVDRIDLVVVDDDLSALQHRNLEEAVGVPVVDRTQLILDIFAQRARTKEGKLQVELAQLTYSLPRLGSAYTKFERQRGGIGMRGPGEQKIDVDRRRVRRRISSVKDELEEVSQHRRVARANRDRTRFPTVALVGYTSAGKSTLLNALAGADVYTDPKLFATLDPTTRRVELPDGAALVTDTVGFIRKLPHHLVAAFRATLEETVESTILVHVVDASHPQMEAQIEAVLDVLEELGIAEKPIVTVFNKSDRVANTYRLRELVAEHPDSVYISALNGDGLPQLLEKIGAVLDREERCQAERAREERRASRSL
jgi:GTP-binding protein HflX